MGRDIALHLTNFINYLSKLTAVIGLLLLSLFIAPVHAEQSVLEAKLSAIKTASKEDENKVKQLITTVAGAEKVKAEIKLVSIYRRSGQLDAAKALVKALREKQSSFDNALQLDIVISQARLNRESNNYEGAVKLMLEQALPLAGDDKASIARVNKLIGNYYRLDKALDAAERHYMVALALYRELGDEEAEADLFGSLGVLYESLDDLVLAAEYQIKSMRYFEKTNDVKHLAGNYFNLGELYYRSQEYDKSMMFYRKALEYDRQLNEIQFIGYDYHRIGSIYLKQNKLVEAQSYTEQAIKIFDEGNYYQVLARSYVQLAEILAAMKKDKERLRYLLLARDAAVEADVEHQLQSVWHALGVYYQESTEYEKSKEYLEKSLLISNRLGLLQQQLADNLQLSELHRLLGQHEFAVQYMQRAFEHQQALNDDKRIKELEKHKRDINLLEEQVKVSQLEEARQKAELAMIEQKELTQKTLFAIIALVIIFLFISYVLYQRRKMALMSARVYEDALKQKNQLLADVSHELRTPLTALKLQVDALRFQLVEDVDVSYQKLSVKITDLSNLIGDIYELAVSDVYGLSINTRTVDLSPVLQTWAEEFKQYTQSEGFTWQQAIAKEQASVDVDGDRIKQLLSNLISNSVKYTDKPGKIALVSVVSKNNLIIELQDSSPSVPDKELPKIFERLYRVEKSRNRSTGGSGLGLAICKNIVQAHNGKIYARQSTLGGLSIIIELPLIQD